MRVLVTGATGFIGGYVVRELLGRGCEVFATSSNKTRAKQEDWFNRVRYIPLDLKELDLNKDYYTLFQRPDKVVHLAWEGLPNYKSLFHIEDNLPRHYHFLKNLVSNGANDITVTGTCFEYGMQEGCLSETLCPMPDNPYALAKDALRQFLGQLQKHLPFGLKWTRLFYMYGKGQNPKSLFPQLELAIERGDAVFNMSGGEQIRDFLPVWEVAGNIVSIALQNEIVGIINCGSGNPTTVKDWVMEYIEKNNARLSLNLGFYPYPDYEPMYFWANIEKLKQIKH